MGCLLVGYVDCHYTIITDCLKKDQHTAVRPALVHAYLGITTPARGGRNHTHA